MQKILIIRPDAIGDFILFSGSLKYYREVYPDASITILMQPHIIPLAKKVGVCDVFKSFSRKKILEDRVYSENLIKELRSEKFDIAIYPVFSREPLGDFITLNVGANETIAFKGDTCNIDRILKEKNEQLYTETIDISPSVKEEINKNYAFISALNKKKLNNDNVISFFAKEDTVAVKEKLQQKNINSFILLAPFSQEKFKQWSLLKWAALTDMYPDKTFVVCGTDKEKDIAEIIRSKSEVDNIKNMCGEFSLIELFSLAHLSEFIVTVDSAAAHIGANLNKTTVIIAGGGHLGRFIPYNRNQRIVFHKMDCYGCHWHCKYETSRCIEAVKPEDIVEVCSVKPQLKVMRETPKNEKDAYLYASLLKSVSNFDQAIEIFEDIIGSENIDLQLKGKILFHLGEIKDKQEKQDEAASYFKKCLDLLPIHKKAKDYLVKYKKLDCC